MQVLSPISIVFWSFIVATVALLFGLLVLGSKKFLFIHFCHMFLSEFYFFISL